MDFQLLLLTTNQLLTTNLKERDDAVPSDGLQQPRGPGEALKPRPTAGEKRANHNDPRRRPGQNTKNWDLFHGETKPWQPQRDMQLDTLLNVQHCGCWRLRRRLTFVWFFFYNIGLGWKRKFICTHLSLRTTLSMQAPNRSTQEMSGQQVKIRYHHKRYKWGCCCC